MPANDARHGSRSRRTLARVISAAAAAAGALALAACSSTTATAPVAVAVAATGTASPGTLTGAGSTYVAPFLALALARYHQQHPAVTIEDIGPESQVMRGPPCQDRVVSGPRGGVLPAGDGAPPRVRVREALATLIISHTPHCRLRDSAECRGA
jgi:ABC-type phosphate transport system substrate-binding protein